MSRKLSVAAIQMDAAPAPRDIRLQAAGELINQTAVAGAQLVVLPELFNTGYTYAPSNYAAAEPPQGPTVAWMRATAVQLNIHLAGSLLLRDGDEIVNALMLFAPDGRSWRYDKIYPWGWERAYFRGGRDIAIAHTDLGDIGFLICWDAAHPQLWRRYAGLVDFMVIASCPPQVSNPVYHFANGETMTFAQMGPLFARIRGSDRAVFGDMLNEQAAWLGAPVINSVGCGRIETHLPNARSSLLAMALLWPPLLKHLPQAEQTVMACDMTPGCKVIGGDGETLAERSQAEGPGFTLATMTLPASRPQPIGPQPPARAPWLAYLISDIVLPFLSQFTYRKR
jgi:hypothetical protein